MGELFPYFTVFKSQYSILFCLLILLYFFKTAEDLAEADKKRREEFKSYEMEKEFEKQQKLKEMDEEKKKKYLEELEEQKKKHKKHDPVTITIALWRFFCFASVVFFFAFEVLIASDFFGHSDCRIRIAILEPVHFYRKTF